jgi:hypothetical protein
MSSSIVADSQPKDIFLYHWTNQHAIATTENTESHSSGLTVRTLEAVCTLVGVAVVVLGTVTGVVVGKISEVVCGRAVGETMVVTALVDGGAGGTVVVSTRGPVTVGMAYGGSKRPNGPQAPHGDAQDLTLSGAASTGSHGPPPTIVAISEGAAVVGQSVPRSLSVS